MSAVVADTRHAARIGRRQRRRRLQPAPGGARAAVRTHVGEGHALRLAQAGVAADLRVGAPRRGWFDENLGIAPQTEAVFNQALKVLEDLGAQIVDIDGRPFSLARKANQTILVCEAYTYHEKTMQETPLKFGSSVRRRILEGAFLSATDYLTAQRARAMLNQQIRANFSRVDVFAVPGAARPPEAFEGMDPNEQNMRPSFTNPFNLTGLPAISVPCGCTEGNLPAGIQFVAPAFEEATCFRAAYAYEQATEWHNHRPEL